MVWINTWLMRDLRTPFGGSGASGLGREGGLEAMRFFTEPRNVGIVAVAMNKRALVIAVMFATLAAQASPAAS